MKTILRFIASSLFLALMVVIGNVTISYAEDTNTNTTTQVEETAATQDVSAEQTNTLTNAEVKNGWTYDDDKGQWLYYKDNKLFTGWITENEGQEKGHYYVDNGVKVEDAFKTIGNDCYHFDYNGNVSTGLFTEWDDSKDTSVTYFADADGKLFKEGLKTIDNIKYYFEKYAAVTNQRKLINGKYYFFKEDGSLLTGEGDAYINDQYTRVLADKNGVLVNGWREVSIDDNAKNWNYFENGFAVTEGTKTIDGSTYSFDYDGLVKGYYSTEEKGTEYYIDNQTSRTGSLLTGLQLVDGHYEYYNANHTKLKTGWKNVNGYWYYFEDYSAVTDDDKEIDGKHYSFGYDAKMKVGWIRSRDPYISSGWYYADSSGAHIAGRFATINGVKYAFDNSGYWCANGTYNIGEKKYTFDKNGKIVTGWYRSDRVFWYNYYGAWFYSNNQGIAYTGWKKIAGKSYYFDTDIGYMYTGSRELPDHKIYIFDRNGAWVEIKKQGWLKVDDYWWFYIDKNLQPVVGDKNIKGHNYHFSNEDFIGLGKGTMYADEVLDTSDDYDNETKRTYFDENGYRVDKITAGWHLFGGEWYYYDADNKPHDGLLQYKGNTYFIDAGKMIYDDKVEIDEDKHIAYFFDKNGKKVFSGWCQKEYEVYWFYADKSKNGQLVNGLKTINGKLYYFDYYHANVDEFVFVNTGNDNNDIMYHTDKSAAIIVNDWYEDFSHYWYYFGDDGKAYENTWLNNKGKWYYFDGNGYMVTGYYNIWNDSTNKYTTYKFDENGVLMTGWEKIDNKWYYFDGDSNYATGWKKIGNTWYYFSDLGKMMTGWQLINGTYYYFENSGAMAANKWVGNYYLQANGSMAKNTWIGKYRRFK